MGSTQARGEQTEKLVDHSTRIAREKLHDEIWKEPMTTVAQRYGVSSNYLARICERLNIPRPGRGYWQQRAAGLEVDVHALPAPGPGDEIEWARDGASPALAPMTASAPRNARTPRPATHPLLVGARGLFEDVRSGREKTYLVPRKTKLVDIFVTPRMLPRALKIASELFLFLEDRNARVVLAPPGQGYRRPDLDLREGGRAGTDLGWYDRGNWQPSTPTTALVEDVAFGLSLFETLEEADAVYRDGKWERHKPRAASAPTTKRAIPGFAQPYVSKHAFSTGRLALRAYAATGVAWSRTWNETDEQKLDTCFSEIATALEMALPKIRTLIEDQKRERESERKAWEEQRERWRREEEERRRKADEAARVKRMQDDIQAWRLARDVRAYVAEVRSVVRAAGFQLTKGGDAEAHLVWAEAYADQVDPVSSWRRDIERAKEVYARAAPASEEGDDMDAAAPAAETPDPAP